MNIENINTKKTNVKKLLYLDDKKRENKKEYKADKIFEIKPEIINNQEKDPNESNKILKVSLKI